MIKTFPKGFTLIELMVALVLGLMVMAGVYSLLSSNQQTVSMVRANGLVSNSGKNIADILDTFIHQAGYRDFNLLESQTAIPASGSWLAKQVVTGSNNVTNSGTVKSNTDVLMVRYYGSGSGTADNTIFNCAGTGINRSVLLTVTFYVNQSNQFICSDSQNNNITLATNVDTFQVNYILGSGTSQENNTAPSGSEWLDVNAVEFAVLLATSFDAGISTKTSFDILGTTYQTSNDHKLRQVFSKTTLIRNSGG